MMVPTHKGYGVEGAVYRVPPTPYPFPCTLYFSLHE